MSIFDNFLNRFARVKSANTMQFSHRAEESNIKKLCSKCRKRNCNCKSEWDHYSLDQIVHNLPFISQSANLKARIIFSQDYNFIPKDKDLIGNSDESVLQKIEEDREKLFNIFQRRNPLGESLADLIFESVEETELYGHTGLQAFDWLNPDTLYFQNLRWNNFLIVANELKRADRGRRKILYYFIDLIGVSNESVELNLTKVTETDGEYKYKLIPHEFVHFRLNSKTAYGLSPLYYDRLTIQFVLDALRENIDEVNNNGYKGIILKGMKGMRPSDFGINGDALPDNWQDELVKTFMKSLRESMQGTNNKDNTLYLNGNLVEDITQLKKATNPVEYMQYIDTKAAVLSASMLGIHPGFLGAKDSTYAQNLEQAIKFAIIYSIRLSQSKYEELITTQILDRYINNTGYLNYEYRYDIGDIDLSDPKQESEILKAYSDFITKLRESAFLSIDEGIEWLNSRVEDLNLGKLDNESGEAKTTTKPMFPVNIQEDEEIE